MGGGWWQNAEDKLGQVSSELVNWKYLTESFSNIAIIILSQACSIPDTGSLILTGGKNVNEATARVARYTETGNMTELPDLKTPRYDHACAVYTTDTGVKVSVYT